MRAVPRAARAWRSDRRSLIDASPIDTGAAAPTQAVRFRNARLTAPADFDRVFVENQRARIDSYLVLARPNQAGHARLGMVVSKRLLPRAVDRNRVKRCVRASFRQVFPELPACDFVVRLLARPAVGEESRELASALRRAGQRAADKWPVDPAPSQLTRPSHG